MGLVLEQFRFDPYQRTVTTQLPQKSLYEKLSSGHAEDTFMYVRQRLFLASDSYKESLPYEADQ